MTRPAAARLAILAGLALAVAACASGTASVSAPGGGSSPSATATIASSPPSTPVGTGTPVASAPAVATGAPTDGSLGSPAYHYRLLVPADLAAGSPIPAAIPWDGAGLIDSAGPNTDKVNLAAGRLLFVYGAPTELDLKAYATTGQALKAAWHGCPTTPDAITETTFGGEPALLYSYDCGGNHMLSLYTVRDGFGLVVNILNPPPADRTANAAIFGEAVSGGQWTD